MTDVQKHYLIRTACLVLFISLASVIFAFSTMSHGDAIKNAVISALSGVVALVAGWYIVIGPMGEMVRKAMHDAANARANEFAERFRMTVDQMEEGIVVHDATGKITDFNRSALAILGLTEMQILALHSRDPRWRVVDETGADLPPERHPSILALATGRVQNIIAGIHRPDGRVRWLRISSSPIFPSGGSEKPVGAIANFWDITESQINSQRVRVAMEAVRFGIWDWNLADRELYWDESMFRLLGYTEQSQPTRSDGVPMTPIETWHQSILPEDGERLVVELRQSLEKGKGLSTMYRASRVDGEVRMIRCQSQAFFDADGKPLRLVGVSWDVTEQVEQEMRALQASKMSSLGEMSAGIAHEINNPLAIIMGKTDAIRAASEAGELDQATLDRHTRVIEKTTARIAKIVRGLRTFSRESDNDPFEPVSVSELLDDTLSLCRARFASNSIELEVSDVDPRITIECRAVQVSQVLLNLLNNAYDAIENAPVRWVKVDVSEADDKVEFRITDSGSGIPKSVRDRIMQPFFTTKEIGRGTGLGLSISLGIAQTHGGRLTLDEACANTRFVFALPRMQGGIRTGQSTQDRLAS